MTVGIHLTNGLEAVVITDSRLTSCNRKSDSVDKMYKFSNENYHGVIFGAGNAIDLKGIFEYIDDFLDKDIKKFLDNIHKSYKIRTDELDNQWLKSIENEITKKSFIIADELERKRFIQDKTHEALQRYDQSKQNPEYATSFNIVAYVKELNRITFYNINVTGFAEIFSDRIELGSGRDGAEFYLKTKLQGVSIAKLAFTDLVFFAVNAYSMSTLNEGVGGTPKIAVIKKDQNDVLPMDKTIALANLSGAYLSEFNTSELTNLETRKLFSEILTGKSGVYDILAKKLRLNENSFKTLYIPYSCWQETANRELFPSK